MKITTNRISTAAAVGAFAVIAALFAPGAVAPARADMDACKAAVQAQDHEAALAQCRAPADEGQADAQYVMGVLYDNGLGVDKDAEAASAWFVKAADQDQVQAMFMLGVMNMRGEGGQKDAAAAAKWWRRAAEAGDAPSQFNLAMLTARGEGVEKDVDAAARLYRISADQGFPMAQVNLGIAYAKGEGVPKDMVQAHAWFAIAAQRVPEQMRPGIERLEKKAAAELTPEQLAESEAMVNTWHPTPPVTPATKAN